MNIRIVKLTLRCKKAIISVPFSGGVTYFYGKMGAGKSTILRLIDYCLGSDLVDTPALQQEFNGAQLDLLINDTRQVAFSRDKGSNQINVTWMDLENEETWSVLAPITTKQDGMPLLPDSSVYNLSDMIFYLCGLQSPKVRKSKLKAETELIRLSFRDLMWYCYLDQDEIDSSFYYLGREEHDYKRNKSRDVMRLVLGYHQEDVAHLEGELYETRKERTSKVEAVTQIKNFLLENNIADAETIKSEIAKLQIELQGKLESLEKIKSSVVKEPSHILDDFKSKALLFTETLEEMNRATIDVEDQIKKRKRLQNEFNLATLKIERSLFAHNVLQGATFCNCPDCGQEIKRVTAEGHCGLCKQETDRSLNASEAELFQIDLRIRQNELKDSISRLESQRTELVSHKNIILNEKGMIDRKITELEKDYDSAYLAFSKEYQRSIGSIEAQIESLFKLLPLPQKIDKLYKEIEALGGIETRLKLELAEARVRAEKDMSNLNTLKEFFLDNLDQVGFPGITNDDLVDINSTDFIPHITRMGQNELFVVNFSNISSGGKKTVFKCCFALAVHRLAALRQIALPYFLMIDTPMKNISERENRDIFEGFYKFLYKLYATELRGRQLIIVDKEFYRPEDVEKSEYYQHDENFIVRHMTPDDDRYPPLIDYYRGH